MMQFQNLSSDLNWYDAFLTLKKALNEQEFWVSPSWKMERLIFSSFSIARRFLETLPGASWVIKEKIPIDNICIENCDLKKKKELSIVPIQNFSSPMIICAIDTAFEIDRILNAFGNKRDEIKLEILTENVNKSRETLIMFLQDKLPELELSKPPRCSLIHSQYEIDYTELQKQRKKRSRKPPSEFQLLLKKNAPTFYPAIIGNQYFGKKVFLDYYKILRNPGQKNFPLPPSPLKYYDLFTYDGAIELRFDTLMPLDILWIWLDCLKEMVDQNDGGIEMFRCAFFFDAWKYNSNYKISKGDVVYITMADYEMALNHKNYSLQLNSDFVSIANKQNTIYFHLSNMDEDSDFRLEIFNKMYNTKFIIP